MLSKQDLFGISSVQDRIAQKSSYWMDQTDGDFHLNLDMQEHITNNAKKRAAVLIGLVEREGECRVILTKRTEKLASHSGQISFPGGKIDEGDASAEAAALREAQEEIGLDAGEVEVIGRLPDYFTGSGFNIAPIIGAVKGSAGFEINQDEVDYMFEVPLAFLMDKQNHQLSSKFFAGRERYYYEMPYKGHYIWGVTAGIIRVFGNRIFGDESD